MDQFTLLETGRFQSVYWLDIFNLKGSKWFVWNKPSYNWLDACKSASVDTQLFTFASNFCNMVRYINIHFIGKEEVTVSINIQYALKFKSYIFKSYENLNKCLYKVLSFALLFCFLENYNGFDQQYVISIDVVKFDEIWHRKMCLQSSHTTK